MTCGAGVRTSFPYGTFVADTTQPVWGRAIGRAMLPGSDFGGQPEKLAEGGVSGRLPNRGRVGLLRSRGFVWPLWS